jgi:signal transduction histidine kinase
METLRILVTDDEPGLRMAAERALRDFTIRLPSVDVDVNFRIDTAETGEDALEKITNSPPDILLLDYKLPGLSGLDILENINGKYPEMLAIMVTAYATVDTAVKATKRGAYDFLAKPFTPVELRNTIRKAANRIALAKQARQLAEEKRQVRFQFIRVLGHELKAPLNAIEGYLQIMAGKTMGPEVAAYEQSLERSLVRIAGMRKLIGDLLDMTRIESGQKSRELVTLDVRQLAKEAIELAAPAARESGVSIELHADNPVPMRADRGEIEMILNNLISNAVKYNRPQGRVDVTLSADADSTTIQVADTGIGMTSEDAAKLFGEFVRIKNEKTRHVMGSGLGLSIVKKLAELYDGSAAVASQPDVGSTFTVKLKSLPKS